MIKFYETEINIEIFFFNKSHAFAWITLNIKSCKPQTYQKQNKPTQKQKLKQLLFYRKKSIRDTESIYFLSFKI